LARRAFRAIASAHPIRLSRADTELLLRKARESHGDDSRRLKRSVTDPSEEIGGNENVGDRIFLIPQDASLTGLEAHWQAYLANEEIRTNLESIQILDL